MTCKTSLVIVLLKDREFREFHIEEKKTIINVQNL